MKLSANVQPPCLCSATYPGKCRATLLTTRIPLRNTDTDIYTKALW